MEALKTGEWRVLTPSQPEQPFITWIREEKFPCPTCGRTLHAERVKYSHKPELKLKAVAYCPICEQVHDYD
jgi:transcription elongation factor Elf1